MPDKSKSLAEGAIEPWTKPRYRQLAHGYATVRARQGNSTRCAVPATQRRAARMRLSTAIRKEDFPGVKGFFAWLERKKYKLHVRVFLSRYRGYATCPDCQRHASARRSARRENRGTVDHRSLPDDGEGGAAVLSAGCSLAPRKPRSPTKCSRKFSSGCGFSMRWDSIT